jgi:8-oxo-dGTP diphosphatase
VSEAAPIVGVGAVVVREGSALLVRRGKPPLLGRWLVPGGTVELGETLVEALVREVREETAVEVEPVEVLAVLDRIERSGAGVDYHYVIVDYLCRWVSGSARAGSDALEVAWARPAEMRRYEVPSEAAEIVEEGIRRAANGWTAGPGALRVAPGTPILGAQEEGEGT